MELSNEIIGLVAGILTAASMIPQLIKTFRSKKAGELSTFIFVLLLAGTGLWTYYGFLKDDLPIIVTNSFSFLLNGLMLILKFKYSDKSVNG
ncbi:SemiSWEET family sugar transporter [Desertivirga xinjiangensis]|uniref:SemiSWEET family sugar transporter n=1 Tax=Desertivirga xinjiangensis TaxID=539206 RepID=UPI00210D32CA|nr:SemiSWEET transporter [Pedobacter xinjiangensis]